MLTAEEIRDIVKDEMQERFEEEYDEMIRATVISVLKQIGLDRVFDACRKSH